MRSGVFGDVWILAGKIARHIASLAFAFLDVLTRPKGIEIIWIGQKVEIFALDERLSKKDRILCNADMSQEVAVLDVVLDDGHFIAGGNILASMPTLFNVR